MEKHTGEYSSAGQEAAAEAQGRKGPAGSDKLGSMPVGKLLAGMSVPIMISMLVQAMYNVVDSIFVARLGQDALAAVGLVFPVQMLMMGVGIGTGIGVGSLLSRRLGEGNRESANRVAVNGLFLALASWILFALIGMFGSRAFIGLFGFGFEPGGIGDMAVSYMQYVTVGSFAILQSVIVERLLVSTGRPALSMIAQMSGAVANIILDPIMIFGLFGFPMMGVAGAALATVVGQFASMGVGLFFNLTRNRDIRFRFRGFRPAPKTIKHIYQVGLPGIIMQSVASVMIFFMNQILVPFGTTAVSVFGVYFKLQSFVFMPAFGLNSGMIPIIAYNYGARRPDRIRKTVRLALLTQVTILSAGALLFWLIPDLLLLLFDAKEDMMTMGTDALRLISLSYPAAAGSIAFTGIFQAIGQGVNSLVMSVVRQVVFLMPLAFVLARLFGMPELWYAFPVSELCSLGCALLLYRRAYRLRIAPLEASPAASP